MRREGVLVEASIRGGTLERLALLPVLLDDGGYPTLRREQAEQFATLLRYLSPNMGTEFLVRDGAIVVTRS
jgi:hypothetical protein